MFYRVKNSIKALFLMCALFPGMARALEYREVGYLFGSNTVVWEAGPAHVLCDGCPPMERLSYVPADYTARIVKVRAPQGARDISAQGKKQGEVEEDITAYDTCGSVVTRPLTVYFGFDSYRLKETELERLKDFVESISLSEDNMHIEVLGFTSDIGTGEYNDVLAVKRAEAVYLALIGLGISEERINMSGKGGCCYVSEEKGKNRRVEVIPYKTGVQ